jgi:hypothetical protein
VSINITIDKSVSHKLPLKLHRAISSMRLLFIDLEREVGMLPCITFNPKVTKPVNLTSIDIIGNALAEDITVKIKLYTQSFWSSVVNKELAMVDDGEPGTIYFNTRALTDDITELEWRQVIGEKLTIIFDAYSPYHFSESAPVMMGHLLAAMELGSAEPLWV